MNFGRVLLTTTLAGAAGALAFGAPASPALGATHTLALSGPSEATVGKPMLLQLSGQAAPPEEWWDVSWLWAVAIPGDTLSSCPVGGQDGIGISNQVGGRLLTNDLVPLIDAQGHFVNQIGLTPWAPGRLLICAYSLNDVGTTKSAASLEYNVRAAQFGGGPPAGGGQPPAGGRPGAAKPANLKRPRIKRAGRKLSCTAGTWSNGADRYSYRWLVDGKRRKGATGRRLGLTRGLRGRTVQCSVTASNSAGRTAAYSRPLRVR
ncbi:MAG TPA: hypothetical protein VGF25_21480 [Thermoleophilaceae bacterium]|jgi:hypothetical protein